MRVPKVEELTLREKIGQTCIFYSKFIPKIEDLEEYFTQNPIGVEWSVPHTAELYKASETALGNPELLGKKNDMHINLLNTLNKYMKVPVMAVMDAESGIRASMFENHAELPNSAALGASNDPKLAYEYGKVLAEDLRSIGFRWLWSPVADNPGHFSDTRAMGCNRENTGKMLAAFVQGLQDNGVAGCVKHFPGHDPYDSRDTHFCTASYSQSYEEWEKTQMLDFKACIDAGVASVMVRHATFKAVDDTRVNGVLLPATLSHKIVTGLLKEKMGFEGVVLTDDITMKALTAVYPDTERLYVEILRAGVDMVLRPTRLDYIDIVEKAVLSGDLPESRIDDACRRVLAMKEKFGVFSEDELSHPTEEQAQEIREKIAAVSKAVSEKSISLCANRTNFLPVSIDKVKKVKIVYIGYSDECYENLKYAAEEFAAHGAECDIQRGFMLADNPSLPQYDLIIYATYIDAWKPAGAPFFFEDECKAMRKIMTACAEKSMGVSFGSPDIFYYYFTAAHTFVNAYGYAPEIVRSFVKGLYGEVQFTDYHPFPLNPITRTNDVYE